jgi:hypothetical protein
LEALSPKFPEGFSLLPVGVPYGVEDCVPEQCAFGDELRLVGFMNEKALPRGECFELGAGRVEINEKKGEVYIIAI